MGIIIFFFLAIFVGAMLFSAFLLITTIKKPDPWRAEFERRQRLERLQAQQKPEEN